MVNIKDGTDGEGEYKRWNKKDKLTYHGFFKDYERYGEFKKWYDGNQLSEHGFFENGRLDGRYMAWDWNGRLIADKIYKFGGVIHRNITEIYNGV